MNIFIMFPVRCADCDGGDGFNACGVGGEFSGIIRAKI